MNAENWYQNKGGEIRRARFAEWPGAERLSALTHAKICCGRESFHAASVTRAGGERSWISAAVNLSMTFIGPPHLGQRQRSGQSSVEEACCWACGCCSEPNN